MGFPGNDNDEFDFFESSLIPNLVEGVDVPEDEVEFGVAAALVRAEHDRVRGLRDQSLVYINGYLKICNFQLENYVMYWLQVLMNNDRLYITKTLTQ